MPAPNFPLFLAPMAGVTDGVFRRLCREQGADVLTTEFVSAEGILHRNERTREMIDFDPAAERPVGVQLFGAEPARLAEAARSVVDWVRPDFIDLNFGCPVNKVVSKNGGSSLLRDCPTLEAVARAVVGACAPLGVPVTAKIRIGWDADSINAVPVGRILEDAGIMRLAVHGRTKAQAYAGLADWAVIAEVAEALAIPVIGNGDLAGPEDIARRRDETKIAGVMIGRGAMSEPWIFRRTKEFLATGILPPEPTQEERWEFILRHARLHVAARAARSAASAGHDDRSPERGAVSSLRGRLMAYSRGMPGGRELRARFSQVASLGELEALAEAHLRTAEAAEPAREAALAVG